jgi:hypothetical protein
MKSHTVTLCAAVFLLIAVDALALCRIEGTVLSNAGTPLADANVRVTGPELGAPLTTQTDRDGRYFFEGVRAGIRVQVSVFVGARLVGVGYGLITSKVETIDIKLPPVITTPTTAGDLAPSGGSSGEVRGIVRASDGSSIAGARVSIDATPVTTTTDASGRYTFGKIRSGLALDVIVVADGYESLTRKVSVPGDEATDVDFALAAAGPAQDRGARVVLHDLSRAAQFLTPRATTPDAPATTYEGFHWYPFSRLFLDLGGLPPEPLAAVRPIGKATGGVEVSAFGTAGRVNVPVTDRGFLVLTARHSLPGTLHDEVLDVFAGGTGTAVRDRAPRDSVGVFQARPAPGFSDVNARLQLAPGRGNRLSIAFYDARDEENYSRDQPTGQSTALAVPAAFSLPPDSQVQAGDAQSWKGRGVSASWARDWSPRVTMTASAARSRFSKTHDQGFFLTSPLTGVDYAVAAGRETSSGLTEQNEIRDTTAKLGASIRAGFRHAIEIGAEMSSVDVTADVFTEASRQTDSAARGAIARVPLLQRNVTGRTSTLFAQDIWRPAGRLVVSPGVRVTHYNVTGTSYADPRVSASYPVAPRVELNASWSIDHQFAQRVTREDRAHGDGDIWILADGSQIPVARVQRAAGGLIFEAPGARVDARLFYDRLDDIALIASRPLTGVAPTAGSTAFHQGSGTIAGLDVAVEQRSARNGFRATYRLARAEYSYPTLEAGTFPASDDERHRLTIVDWVPIRAGWSVGAAWVIAQGRPVTPLQSVQQVWFPAGDLAYEPVFGARNSERLRAYSRLDLSSQIVRRFGAVSSTLGLTVFNVDNRDNVLFNDYQTVGSAASIGPIVMMHRAVNVFFKVGF